MNELKIFNNDQFGQVRVVELKNEPWFVAKDICDILDIQNPTMSLKNMDSDELTKYNLGGQHGEVSLVNESGLYNLIFKSRKEEAKKFRKWVTSEVLPDIRKHGLYMTNNVLEQTLSNPQFMIDLLQKYKEEKDKVQLLVHAGKLYTSTEIAKELGFTSAKVFNKDLEQKGIQYKVNKTWVLSSKYANRKYTSIKETVLDNDKVIYDRKWTGLGRAFLLETYKGEIQ